MKAGRPVKRRGYCSKSNSGGGGIDQGNSNGGDDNMVKVW